MKKTAILVIFILLLKPICSQNPTKDFKAIESSLLVSDYTNYLSKYTKGKYVKIANQRKKCLEMRYAYEEAVKKRDIGLFENYINNYKDFNEDCSKCGLAYVKYTTNNIQDIEIKLKVAKEVRDWNNAMICNTLSCFKKFVEDYPASYYLKRANDSILVKAERDEWENAKRVNTVQSFSDYKTHYPYGKYTSNAELGIKNIESWLNAKNQNLHELYSQYLLDFPQTIFMDSAKYFMQVLEQKDWDKALKTNTYKGYADFEKKFPNGYYFQDAEKKIIDMEIADVKKKSPFAQWSPMEVNEYLPRNEKNSKLIMKNDTEYIVKVMFSGPEPKRVEIAPGTTIEFELLNGEYTVSASVPNSTVDPFWGLETYKGFEYSNVWYIKTDYFRGFR
jgi:outer membrane protein assembly factor BamD (BamD/ComL family)